MEDFDYKLVMFGFSALCEELENGDECFLVNLKTKEIFPITLENEKFVIKDK